MANPAPAAAATAIKVVIVVGPVGSQHHQLQRQRQAVRQRGPLVRREGHRDLQPERHVVAGSRAAAQGANLLIYLGHGNGWPSPYGPFSKYTKDGIGPQPRPPAHGNSNNKYYGEYYIARDIELAPNAVVILNRLCYASGNSEWGRANPTKSTAIKRVDNYGAGFLRAGASGRLRPRHRERVVHDPGPVHDRDRTMDWIFMSRPGASGARDFAFTRRGRAGMQAHMDPPRAGKYWRSFIGEPERCERPTSGPGRRGARPGT